MYVQLTMAERLKDLRVIDKKLTLEQLAEPVPLVIRNAPTALMADLNYGKGYQYAHDTKERIADMQCLPPSLADREYYLPTDQGNEGIYRERLEWVKNWRKEHHPD